MFLGQNYSNPLNLKYKKKKEKEKKTAWDLAELKFSNVTLEIVLCALLTVKFENIFSEKNAFSVLLRAFKTK